MNWRAQKFLIRGALGLACLLLIGAACLYFFGWFFMGGREKFYESHSFPNKPTIEIRVVPGFMDANYYGYLVQGWRKTKLFWLADSQTYHGPPEGTNSVVRVYQGTCKKPYERIQMYEVFWSKDGQKVAVSFRGFYVAAYDLKAREKLEFLTQGPPLQSFDQKVEAFMQK